MSSTQLASTVHAEEQKLLACVHCGLCLEACPTYTVTGDENDGPRGRLYLMRAVAENRLNVESATFERHINRCLGCRACESVCPAGVEYGQLLEASRGELFQHGTKQGAGYKLLHFVLRHIWLHPGRLKWAFRAARVFRDSGFPRMLRMSGLAKVMNVELSLALLESSASGLSKTKGGEEGLRSAASHGQRSEAMLFKGCIGEGLFSQVNKATERVLSVNGYHLEHAYNQVCCGALHAHAGDLEGARTLARRNIRAFGEDEEKPIVTNAGGCGAMLLSYGHLLAEDETFKESAVRFSERVRDVGQLLDAARVVRGVSSATGLVTYDASCHLLHGQHASDDSLAMLRAIAEVEFVPLKDADRCCGGAGVYNLLEPALSSEVLSEKLAHIRESGAQTLATGNPGCQMQIAAGAHLAGMKLRVCHPVELLDESYRRAGIYKDSERG